MMSKILKEVSISKNDSPLTQHMGEDITNADIFVTTRELQDSAIKQGVNITNLSEVYHWAVEQRDLLKAR